jgi:hypothetical protein
MELPFTDEELLVILESSSFAMNNNWVRLAEHLDASYDYLSGIRGKLNDYLNNGDFSNVTFSE